MRLLITGAAGMLGLDLRAAAEAADHDCIALTRAELDITDTGRRARGTERRRSVDAVINCAAHTNVDGAESDSESAFAVNGAGAGNVAAAPLTAPAPGWCRSRPTMCSTAPSAIRTWSRTRPGRPRSTAASKLDGEMPVAKRLPTRTRSSAAPAVRDRRAVLSGDDAAPGGRARGADGGRRSGRPARHSPPSGVVAGRARGGAAPARRVVHVTPAGQCSWYQFAVEIMRRAGAPQRRSPRLDRRPGAAGAAARLQRHAS